MFICLSGYIDDDDLYVSFNLSTQLKRRMKCKDEKEIILSILILEKRKTFNAILIFILVFLKRVLC